MNYYQRHLGDYARKAGHLSMLEHGAYNLILDAYYDREVPPTRAEAIRYARARSPEEVAAVDAVLAEFFYEEDGRFIQARVEEEFGKVAVQADKNRNNGRKGGRPRKEAPAFTTSEKPKKTQWVSTETQVVILENPNETQTKGNPLIQESINPREEKQEHAQPAAAPSRFAEFWAAYPNKKSRQEAEKAWRKLRLDSRCDELIAHVRLMAATDSDWLRGYCPHGSTYLNQARWEDVPKRPPSAAPPAAAPGKTMQALLALQGMKDELDHPRDSQRLSETPLPRIGPSTGW